MEASPKISARITMMLVYGRPPLVFAAMVCAIGVMLNRNAWLYSAGALFLFSSMVFDLVDGWFAARFSRNTSFAQLADRIMDRIVYSIVFPLVSVGMMWRLLYAGPAYSRLQLVHAILVMLLCITVLIRDNFARFMRDFAIRFGEEPGLQELNRLRTIVAAPLGLILYMHAFYIPPGQGASPLYMPLAWLGTLPARHLFVVEIIFLIINFGSIAAYCRKYGNYCLDELCADDELLRRRILAVFPNALTVMNAMMGLLAVFFAFQEKMTESYLLLIGAAIFDKLDGAMARKMGLTEPLPGTSQMRHVTLGGILDDIADGVSFCIAPAWIFYIVFTQLPDAGFIPFPPGIVALVYAGAGFLRLVYFTLDRNPIPGFFKGMPTPAAALLVTAPLLILSRPEIAGTQWGAVIAVFTFGLMPAAAILMNLYPVKYIHMGRFMDRNPWFTWTNMALMLILVFTPYFGYLAFFQMLLYTLSPFFIWQIDPRSAAMESKKSS
jgi:phosphatidylserine synthase